MLKDSFFLLEVPPGAPQKIHHSSYEVLSYAVSLLIPAKAALQIEDFDQQLIGHEWLTDKGYQSSWGVGRHVLGSQIFDYWFDPSGHHVEHYVSGCNSVRLQSIQSLMTGRRRRAQ